MFRIYSNVEKNFKEKYNSRHNYIHVETLITTMLNTIYIQNKNLEENIFICYSRYFWLGSQAIFFHVLFYIFKISVLSTYYFIMEKLTYINFFTKGSSSHLTSGLHLVQSCSRLLHKWFINALKAKGKAKSSSSKNLERLWKLLHLNICLFLLLFCGKEEAADLSLRKWCWTV